MRVARMDYIYYMKSSKNDFFLIKKKDLDIWLGSSDPVKLTKSHGLH